MELRNFAVGTVSSKCSTSSDTEGDVEVTPKMYNKYMKQFIQLNFSI